MNHQAIARMPCHVHCRCGFRARYETEEAARRHARHHATPTDKACRRTDAVVRPEVHCSANCQLGDTPIRPTQAKAKALRALGVKPWHLACQACGLHQEFAYRRLALQFNAAHLRTHPVGALGRWDLHHVDRCPAGSAKP